MKKFWLSLCVLLCCVSVSRAQAEYPDVPLDDSAYSDLNILLQQRGIESYDGGRGRTWTRYEFAVVMARSLYLFEEKDTAEKRLPLSTANTYSFDVVAAVKRLANKFLPELKELGIDATQIKINGVFLIEPKVAPPFPDVPKNHWAFDAVEKLRLSGILVGYPETSSARSD